MPRILSNVKTGKEGLKEGRKEGLKEGRKEGLKEGLKEGRKEGLNDKTHPNRQIIQNPEWIC